MAGKKKVVESKSANFFIHLWHPINGKWMHLQQIIKGNSHKYYVDGILVRTERANTLFRTLALN